MGAKIQQSVTYLLTEDEFWVGHDSVQNTGPGCKPELGKTLSTTIRLFERMLLYMLYLCCVTGTDPAVLRAEAVALA
jgi:hypothetical protein